MAKATDRQLLVWQRQANFFPIFFEIMFLVAVIGYFAYNTNGKPKCKNDITHKPLLGILLLSSFNFF